MTSRLDQGGDPSTLIIGERDDVFLDDCFVPGHESDSVVGTAASSQRMAAESMTEPTSQADTGACPKHAAGSASHAAAHPEHRGVPLPGQTCGGVELEGGGGEAGSCVSNYLAFAQMVGCTAQKLVSGGGNGFDGSP